MAGTDHTVCTTAATAGKQGSGASMCVGNLDPVPAWILHVCNDE